MSLSQWLPVILPGGILALIWIGQIIQSTFQKIFKKGVYVGYNLWFVNYCFNQYGFKASTIIGAVIMYGLVAFTLTCIIIACF